MPKVEVLRQRVMATRLTVKRLRRELSAAMSAEYRHAEQLKMALDRRVARAVDRELDIGDGA